MKTHLTYKVDGKETGAARCGNNSRGYKYGLKVAFAKEFRNLPSTERCAHCENLYLDTRNALRRKKGLEPVKTPFEMQEHAK
jgi:hypothetical protein